MIEKYWDGATWVYQADITNDGSNSGNHDYSLTQGEGDEMEVLYGNVLNGDVASRTVTLEVRDPSGEVLYRMELVSVGAGVYTNFPHGDAAPATAAQAKRLILSGPMILFARVASVATSQDSAFGIVARIRGGVPTVTLASPTDAVEVVNTNRVA